MNSQQKAKEIYDKLYSIPLHINTIRKCCNVVIDEILREKQECNIHECNGNTSSYWEDVRQQVEKI